MISITAVVSAHQSPDDPVPGQIAPAVRGPSHFHPFPLSHLTTRLRKSHRAENGTRDSLPEREARCDAAGRARRRTPRSALRPSARAWAKRRWWGSQGRRPQIWHGRESTNLRCALSRYRRTSPIGSTLLSMPAGLPARRTARLPSALRGPRTVVSGPRGLRGLLDRSGGRLARLRRACFGLKR
jgi:hypothetical protein